MNLISKVILVIFFLLLGFKSAYSLEKIAYINLETILQETTYGKRILDKLNLENEKNINDLKLFENELKSIESDIKKKQNIISQEEYENEIKKLNIKIKKYNNEKNQLVDNFKKIKNEQLKVFFNEINPYITKFMSDNSISILLDSKKVYIGRSESDITSTIVDLINLKIQKWD